MTSSFTLNSSGSFFEPQQSTAFGKPPYRGPVLNPSSVLNPQTNNILVIGGKTANSSDYTWDEQIYELEVQKKQWKTHKIKLDLLVAEKFNFYGHCSVCVDNKVYIFAGTKNDKQGMRVLSVNLSTYTLEECVMKETPFYRSFCSLTHVPNSKRALVFGGITPTGQVLDDLYTVNLDSGLWEFGLTFGAVPSPRCGHAAAVVGNFMYIFGGYDGTNYLNDLYVLDLENLSWTYPTTAGAVPSPRAYCTTVVQNDKIIFIGGKGSDGICQDSVYVLHTMSDGEALWTRHQAPTELCREGHTAQLIEPHIIVIGGSSASNNESDIYILSIERLMAQSNQWKIKPMTQEVRRTPQMQILRHKSREDIQRSDAKPPTIQVTTVANESLLSSSNSSLQSSTGSNSGSSATTSPNNNRSPTATPTLGKKEQFANFKVAASVGEISSIVNFRVDLNITTDLFIEKILKRFPETEGATEYAIYAPVDSLDDGGLWLEEGKPLIEYESILEEAKFTVELKRKALKKQPGLMGKIFGRRQSQSNMEPLKVNPQENALVAVISAAREGLKDDLAQLLKQEGKEILRAKTNDDLTPLHLASQEGHYDCVSIILKYKPDLNGRDKHGWTALHCAAAGGHLRIVDLLMNAGIDSTIVTEDNNTVLHYLAKTEWNENISPRLLASITKRTDINSVNQSNETPLHRACLYGNIEFVKTAIRMKADLNIRNKHGETCLHFAARGGKLEIVNTLLENGADPNIAGDQGTVKEVAEAYGYEVVSSLIPSAVPTAKQNAMKEIEAYAAEIAAADPSIQPVLDVWFKRYQQEVNRRLAIEETLGPDQKNAMKKIDDLEAKLKEENRKRVVAEDELVEQIKKNNTFKDLLKQEGRTRTDLKSQLTQLQHQIQSLQQGQKDVLTVTKDKDKLSEALDMVTQQFKQEESQRKQLEEKLAEKNKELIQAYQEIAKLQALQQKFEQVPVSQGPTPTQTADSEKEKHLALCKDLKIRIAASHTREWDAIYSSAEVDDAIPGVKTDSNRNEQVVWEWHASKITEIQSMFFPSGEEDMSLVEPHRRFIKTGSLTTVVRGNPTTNTLFLFNDVLLICTMEEKYKKYLFVNVIPLDFCSVGSIGDANENLKNAFIIVRTDTKQTAVMYSPSATDKEKWIKEINACIVALPPIVDQKAAASTAPTKEKDKSGIFKLGKLLKGEKSELALKLSKTSKELQTILQSVEANDPSVTKLMLAKAGMKAKGMQHLAGALLNNSVITQMVLSSNNLEDKGMNLLPSALHDGLIVKLTSLVLDNNGIHGTAPLVDILKRAKNLTELSLADNNLSDELKPLLETVMAHKGLKILNISSNQLNDTNAPAIGDLIRMNHTLTELHMDSNAFTSKGDTIIVKGLTDSIGSALTTISYKSGVAKAEIDVLLKRNKERSERLEKLEKSGATTKVDMKAQTTDEVLDLGYLRMDKFVIAPMVQKITALYLDNCSLLEVPMPLIQNIPSLATLVMLNNKLNNIPKELYRVSTLKELILTNNNLAKISPDIELLSNLTTLGLGGNALFSIPVETCKLIKLKKLYLHGNNIYSLPVQINQLTALEDITLAGNPMPYAVQRIYTAWASKATELDMSNYGLTSVPAMIGIVKSLVTLKLANNKLKSLPPQIAELNNLKNLDVNNNSLDEVPWQLCKLSNLASFNCEGNSKLYMPEDILSVRALLAQKDTQKAKPFRRVKVMLVGRENVGKTSLRQCLQAKSIKQLIKIKKEQGWNLSTDGIDMEYWSPTDEERGKIAPISFNIWDFAGQEVYYTTHQFFINPRSIFLVVFNLKERGEEGARVDYWLQSIRSKSDTSPIILIGTHADEVESKTIEEVHEMVQSKYLRNFKQIKAFLTVSCVTRKGIPTLQETLIRMASEEPYIQQMYPSSFHQLESLVIGQRDLYVPPVISRTEFRAWAEICGITTAEEFDSVCKLLNELGTILHFNDAKSALSDLVILDPQWLTKLLATLITSKPNFVKNGILAKSLLGQIWKAPDFPESLHPTLLYLLEKFEVCFPLPPLKPGEESQGSLIPCLILADKPTNLEMQYQRVGTTRRTYKFTFLPFGFFSRLVIRVMHFMHMLNYWKNCVQLQTEFEGRCLIELVDGLQLNIEITGNNSTKYMRLLCENVDVLLKGWYKVPFQITIPCVCARCLTLPTSKRSVFTLDECEKAVAQGVSTLTCYAIGANDPLFDRLAPELLVDFEVRLDTLAPDVMMSDLMEFRIRYEDLQIKELIGKGGFGEVFKATYNGQQVAVKKLTVDGLTPIDVVEVYREFRREVWLSSVLSHPNIVSLKGCCISPCCLVMEYVAQGNLLSYLQSSAIISPTMRLKIAVNIADAMKCMHSKTPKIIHRDLKSPNILMASLSDLVDVVCKLSDFGESLAVATKALGRANIGNPAWCAPEIMKGEAYSEKVDCFSFGIVLYEIYSRKLPYSEYPISTSKFQSQFEDAIIKGMRPTVPADAPPAIGKLMQKCWSQDPQERPDFNNILATLVDVANKTGIKVKVAEIKTKPLLPMASPRSVQTSPGMNRPPSQRLNQPTPNLPYGSASLRGKPATTKVDMVDTRSKGTEDLPVLNTPPMLGTATLPSATASSPALVRPGSSTFANNARPTPSLRDSLPNPTAAHTTPSTTPTSTPTTATTQASTQAPTPTTSRPLPPTRTTISGTKLPTSSSTSSLPTLNPSTSSTNVSQLRNALQAQKLDLSKPAPRPGSVPVTNSNCGKCGSNVATLKCDQCSMSYCKNCSDIVHKQPLFASHRVVAK